MAVAITRPHLWPIVLAARLLVGASTWASAILVTVYVAELAPPRSRGCLCGISSLFVGIAALLGSVVGLPSLLGSAEGWPALLFLTWPIQLLGIPFLWLLSDSAASALLHGRSSEAKASLRFWEGKAEPRRFDAVAEDAASLSATAAGGLRSLPRLLGEPRLQRPLYLAAAMSLLYYPAAMLSNLSTLMLRGGGLGPRTAEAVTIGLKVYAQLLLIVSICWTDRLGRRPQLLVGTGLALLSLAGLGVAQAIAAPVAFVLVLFVLQTGVNFGIRPLFWVVVAELFPARYRMTARAATGLATNLSNGAASLCVGLGAEAMGGWTYVVLTAPAGLAWLYLALRLPATENRELSAIYQDFQGEAEPLLALQPRYESDEESL